MASTTAPPKRPTNRPTGSASQPNNGKVTAMANKTDSAEQEQEVTQQETPTSNGGKRGRKAGSKNSAPVLTVGTVRSLTAADLGIDLEEAKGMTTKQTGGGRTAEERSELQLQFDADVLAAFSEWYDANQEAIDAGNWPADLPANRIPHFAVVEGVEFTTRLVEHSAETAAKIGRTHTEETYSKQLEETGRYLENAKRLLVKEYPQLVLHVYAPRQHVSGAYLIPWAVYAKQEA